MTFQRCEYCGMGYEDSSYEDIIQHTNLHKKYTNVEATLGFLPRTYEKFTTLQSRAYKLLLSEDEEEQYCGAIDLFRSHFDRSLADAIIGDYWMEHPNFFNYIAMIDYGGDRIPNKIMQRVRENYGRRPDEIPIGDTYWYLPNSKARKKQFQEASRRNKPDIL